MADIAAHYRDRVKAIFDGIDTDTVRLSISHPQFHA